VILGSGEFGVTDVELLIEVRKLSACIFQEEFAIQGISSGKNIGE
jgi:hypothetical protein